MYTMETMINMPPRLDPKSDTVQRTYTIVLALHKAVSDILEPYGFTMSWFIRRCMERLVSGELTIEFLLGIKPEKNNRR